MGVSRVVQRIVFVGVFLALLPAAVWADDNCSCHFETEDHHVHADSEVLSVPLMYRLAQATVRWNSPDSSGKTEKTYELGAHHETDLEWHCTGDVKEVEFKVTAFDQDTHVCETGARYDVFAKLLELTDPKVNVEETGESLALVRQGGAASSGVWKVTWTPPDQDGDGGFDQGEYHFQLEGRIEDDHADHSDSNDPPKKESEGDGAKPSLDLANYSARLTLVKMEVLTKRYHDTEWQESGTTIAAGGKASNVHKASVEVRFDPELPSSETVNVSLTGGGGGHAFSSWWWTHAAVKAVLTLDGDTFTHGDSDPLSFHGAGTLAGTLSSSNKLEGTTISVELPSIARTKTTDVGFTLGDFTVRVGNGAIPVGQWHDFTVNMSLGGVAIDNHELTLVISEVTLQDGTKKEAALGGGEGSSTSLSDYVELDPNAWWNHDYEDVTTAAALPSVSTQLRVVDANVASFVVVAYDRSVKK